MFKRTSAILVNHLNLLFLLTLFASILSIAYTFVVRASAALIPVLLLSYFYTIVLREANEFEIQRFKDLRTSERQGRIRAEQRLKQLQNNQKFTACEGYVFPPIGIVASSFPNRRGTPRQCTLINNLSTIEFHPDLRARFKEITEGLRGYSHLWVVFVFHENTNMAKQTIQTSSSSSSSPSQLSETQNDATGFVSSFKHCRTKIVPPCKHDNVPVGIFASRSPHRPNPIGLSLVRLIECRSKTASLLVEGLDTIDGTPVLDIKPYLKYCDSLTDTICPKWVDEAYNFKPLTVNVPESTQMALTDTLKNMFDEDSVAVNKFLQPYVSVEHLISVIKKVLSYDIRSRHQQNLNNDSENTKYELSFHKLGIDYKIWMVNPDEKIVEVIQIYVK